jgi:hypothetical protein
MPVFQYFGWVGSFLLAALLAANWWFPAPTAPMSASDVPLNQRISIRIRTDHRWPDRVVFDTARSPLALEAKVGPEDDVGPSKTVARAERQPFDAFAQIAASRQAVFSTAHPLVRVRSARPRQEKHASSR